MPPSTEYVFALKRTVKAALAIRSDSTLRAHERIGLLPPRVDRGRGRSAWLAQEVDEVVQARAAGADDQQVCALVRKLISQRPTLQGSA